ncbi:sporulation membrane protein YtaF [Virgibacillus oceani]|uniref:Sporulation membrane protein YtaF n=1 Tax=Virgibacillus oceani TaxID=1479511 RepID=A0A917H5F8_9BACI|nr:sporulation membrane protein YtaF [Virgibacillus oceani]GGG67872.1 sporulation membrane protein YtaF [Virgibacillus oceani]
MPYNNLKRIKGLIGLLFYTGLILLVIGVSLDSFGVGITYGMRRIWVPFYALVIIMFCSGITVLSSMTIGNLVSSFITPGLAKLIGGAILVIIGIFCLYNVFRSKMKNIENQQLTKVQDDEKWEQFKTVMKKPEHADWDHSGTISIKESLILGFALALDALGAGIGAAMLGYSALLTAILIALMSGTLVFFGINIGVMLSERKWIRKLVWLPPFLLIMLGIFNMMS